MKKSRFIVVYLVLLILSGLFLATCKDYSFEGGNLSKYAFITSADSCMGSIVAGEYFKSVVLGANNTITLQVDVTKAGNYHITTESVNGMQFSSSGEFSSTGIQQVVLLAHGTPVSDGNFFFTAPGTLGCTFRVTVTEKPVISAAYTLVGAPDNCQDPTFNGRISTGIGLSSTNTVTLHVHVTSPGAFAISTDTVNGIYFNAAGTFLAAGDQNLTLRGFGTPADPGNFYFKPSTGNAKCSFKLGIPGPEPYAVYVLESGSGNPSPCVYQVAGSYNANVVLNGSHSVTVRVYVTAPGNFTISTDRVNGMMFTYSGAFSTTGMQNVVLQGTGTPATAGNYILKPEIIGPHPLGGESCAFPIVVN